MYADTRICIVGAIGKPTEKLVRAAAEAKLDTLDVVMRVVTLEERRSLIGTYVQKTEADPERNTVQITSIQ